MCFQASKRTLAERELAKIMDSGRKVVKVRKD
jgi:hypothetical protein